MLSIYADPDARLKRRARTRRVGSILPPRARQVTSSRSQRPDHGRGCAARSASTAARPSSQVGRIYSGGSTNPVPPLGRSSIVYDSAPASPYIQSVMMPDARYRPDAGINL
jgi:hypothetical protein